MNASAEQSEEAFFVSLLIRPLRQTILIIIFGTAFVFLYGVAAVYYEILPRYI